MNHLAKIFCLFVLTLAWLPVRGNEITANAFGSPLAERDKYISAMIDKISPAWHKAMYTNQSSLSYGKVTIHFMVHSDGTISDPVVTVGESASLLKNVSLQVLRASAPFKPFSEALIKETGKDFGNDFTFTITQLHGTEGQQYSPDEGKIVPPATIPGPRD